MKITAAGTAVLIVVAVAAVLLSIFVITEITNNFYSSGYYTITALFDAVGVDQSNIVTASVPYLSEPFWIIFIVSVGDGIVKIIGIGFIVAAMIEFVMNVDIRTRITNITKSRKRNHIIVCGYSQLAEHIVEELTKHKIKFLVIEEDPAKVDEIRALGYQVFHEDFSTDTALNSASINNARAVLFLTQNDYENMLGVVTAHHLNEKVKIISRAEDVNAVTKMRRAGAEMCVIPEIFAGLEIGEAIAKQVAR